MRFFVTGATGFIGTHLCRRLVADGHDVTVLARTPSRIAEDLRQHLTVVQGDLSIFEREETELPPADVIVHLAAVIAGDNQNHYDEVNFQAVRAMLSSIRRQSWKPRRFLFASSLAAAGPSSGKPLSEDDDASPIDAYGRAKLAAEALMADQPFPTSTFRPSVVLGPGDPATLTLFKMAHSGLAVLPSFGQQRLSVVEVEELVDAIVRMAGAEDDAHHTYFVASNEETTNEALLRGMAAAMGKTLRIVRIPKPLLYVAMLAATAASKVFRFKNQLDLKQYQQMTAPEFVCSSRRLQRELGWRPQKTLEVTLDEAIRGYRALGQLPE